MHSSLLHSTLTAVLLLACLARISAAQDILRLEDGAVGTYLTLKQLRTTASVLQVVAHPDDEDGAVSAYCARGLGVHTMLFSITRGEGGANLVSNHFFDALGAIRTLEHQRAAGYYGNELYYSRAADYGYSKTLAEAMKQWQDGVPILADLVEVIRRERPTVILSRFRGDPRDGHGHHQMAGVLQAIRLSFRNKLSAVSSRGGPRNCTFMFGLAAVSRTRVSGPWPFRPANTIRYSVDLTRKSLVLVSGFSDPRVSQGTKAIRAPGHLFIDSRSTPV
jgi:hypothetical protein